MQARLRSNDLDCAEFVVDAFDQCTSPLAVQCPHSSDVAGKVPFANKVGHYVLVEIRRSKIHCAAYRAEAIDQVRRHHDIADAQRWKQDFAECSDIDDAGIAVETLQ